MSVSEQAPTSVAPLRLLFLDSIPTWGGGEAWTLETARGLTERGHAVVVGCARGSELEARSRAAALPVWSAQLARRGPLGLVHAARAARSLRARLVAERTQIVVANIGRDVRLGLVAARGGVAHVIQRRGIARRLKRGPLSRWIYAHGLRRVVANCAAIRDELLAGADFADAARFVVVPNGVPLPEPQPALRARARAALGLDADAPVALCVARLAPMKGHLVLLEAWRAVVAEVPDAVLLLAGTGEAQAPVRAAAAPFGASVRTLGFRDDVPELCAAADVFVLPSLRDEGCNNALLQSMAAGLPAVVSDLPALVETAAPVAAAPGSGAGALVARRGSAAELAERLVALFADGELRRRLGRAARERVAREYARDVALERWERLLSAVVAEAVRA